MLGSVCSGTFLGCCVLVCLFVYFVLCCHRYLPLVAKKHSVPSSGDFTGRLLSFFCGMR